MPDARMARRKFLKQAAIAAGTALTLGAGGALAQDRKSRVVQSYDVRAKGDYAYRQALVDEMVSKGITALTGENDPRAAWGSLFKPDDAVAVKVNCLFGPNASTHPEVTNAVVSGLKSAGVSEDNIIVWDRSDGDLTKCGYSINRNGPGVRCYGTGGDYEPNPTRNRSFNGRLSKILTQRCTALVNVPILKDHSIAGITCAMKNHYGSFNNPGEHHGNNCDPYLADLNDVPAIRDKTRLIVCDAIRPLAHGGPGLKPQHLWDCGMLLLSTDPVALDYTGWQIIEERRKAVGLPTLAAQNRPAKHIATAASRGLGTNDPERIELVRV